MSVMWKFLQLLCLVGVAVGQVERCCTPDVWEGSIIGMYGRSEEGHPGFGQNFDRVHYDYTGKKFAWFHRTDFNDGTSRSFRFIRNHVEKKEYFIEASDCFYKTVETEMRRDCIPTEADYRGLVYYGSGERRLNAGRWEIRSSLGATYFTRSLANEGCLPIESTRFVENTETRPFAYAASITFADINPTIEDPEVFIPPETCVPAPPPRYIEESEMYQHLKALNYL